MYRIILLTPEYMYVFRIVSVSYEHEGGEEGHIERES